MISVIPRINSNNQYTPNFTSAKYRKVAQTFDDSFYSSQPVKIVTKYFIILMIQIRHELSLTVVQWRKMQVCQQKLAVMVAAG